MKRTRGLKAKLSIILKADDAVVWEGKVPLDVWQSILRMLPDDNAGAIEPLRCAHCGAAVAGDPAEHRCEERG